MLTAEQLTLIDKIVEFEEEQPFDKPAPWYSAASTSRQVPEDLKLHGVQAYSTLKALKPRSRLERSEWLLVEEGESLRLVPELYLRAAVKYPEFSLQHIPFWKDKEGGEVLLASRPTGESRPRGNKYGFPAGSKEYHEAWKKENRDKLRAASRKYAKKLRESAKELKKLKEAGGEAVSASSTPPPPTTSTPPPNPIEALAARLGVDMATEVVHNLLGDEAPTPPKEQEWTQCPRCETEMPVGSTSCGWCSWTAEAK